VNSKVPGIQANRRQSVRPARMPVPNCPADLHYPERSGSTVEDAFGEESYEDLVLPGLVCRWQG
ncbi:MAG TPA: hypothetical protein VNH18_02125, partial [Bryobacteraceae bacterium]|nr:hypothetical protein [Bryobacteraceae bacterium]